MARLTDTDEWKYRLQDTTLDPNRYLYDVGGSFTDPNGYMDFRSTSIPHITIPAEIRDTNGRVIISSDGHNLSQYIYHPKGYLEYKIMLALNNGHPTSQIYKEQFDLNGVRIYEEQGDGAYLEKLWYEKSRLVRHEKSNGFWCENKRDSEGRIILYEDHLGNYWDNTMGIPYPNYKTSGY